MAERKTVVITGTPVGRGTAIAIEFAGHDAAAGLPARGKEGLESAKRDIEAAGCRALIRRADVADSQEMKPEAYRRVTAASLAFVYRSIPLESAWCAAKPAIAKFAGSLRCELWDATHHNLLSAGTRGLMAGNLPSIFRRDQG